MNTDTNQSTWQPIETAPKDGREVVLAVKYRAGIPKGVLVGHYMQGGHCIEDHPPIAAGWYFWNGREFDLAAEPTHWMPLPHHPQWEPGGWQAQKQERPMPAQAPMPKRRKSVLVDLTDEQYEQLRDTLKACPVGGATFAQVFADGMRVRNFTPEQAKAIAAILGGDTTAPLAHSAAEAHEAATSRARLQ